MTKLAWMAREIDLYEGGVQKTLLRIQSEDEKQLLKTESRLKINSLRKANGRFIKSIALASTITILALLLFGYREAFVSGFMLFIAPCMIAIANRSEVSILKPFPLPEIEKRIILRNGFADSVWGIAISGYLCLVFLWQFTK